MIEVDIMEVSGIGRERHQSLLGVCSTIGEIKRLFMNVERETFFRGSIAFCKSRSVFGRKVFRGAFAITHFACGSS